MRAANEREQARDCFLRLDGTAEDNEKHWGEGRLEGANTSACLNRRWLPPEEQPKLWLDMASKRGRKQLLKNIRERQRDPLEMSVALSRANW